jgi:hypothetical protein
MREIATVYVYLAATVGTSALVSVLRLKNASTVTNSRTEINIMKDDARIRLNYNRQYHCLSL